MRKVKNKIDGYYYKWINHIPDEAEQYTLHCYHDNVQILAPDDDWLGGLPLLVLYLYDDNKSIYEYSNESNEDDTWHVDTDCVLSIPRIDLKTKDLEKAKKEAIEILIKSIHEDLNSDNEFYHDYCRGLLCAITSIEKQ
jgi:hypothetical protein